VIPDDLGEAYVNQHLCLIRPKSETVLPEWLGIALVSELGQKQCKAALYGGTKEGLGLDDVKNLVIPIPPLGDQASILRSLRRQISALDVTESTLRTGIDRLLEYRTALISAAVTGKIDVREEAA
jgi:type I restriction enzyme S subunit